MEYQATPLNHTELIRKMYNKFYGGKGYMNDTHLEQLVRIYNTLTTVCTRGEDTIVMAKCLTSMRDTLLEIQQAKFNKNNSKE